MEQNSDTSAPIAPVVENSEQNGGGNGLKIATAIACIVAVCGIGFGVYGMIQSSQKDNQISDLKAQITKKDETITNLEAKISEKETVIIDVDSDNEIKLSDTEAQTLIESKRQELGYNTWTTGVAKVTKKGDDNYYWVVYEEKNNEGYTSELNVIFHYEDGDWVFSIPGFSGTTAETIEKYNFKDL